MLVPKPILTNKKSISILTSLLSVLLISFWNSNAVAQNSVQKGVYDLRTHNFIEDPIVSLSGEWEFYWNELLLTSEIQNRNKEYRAFTKDWSNEYSSFGYATYRLTILLPNNIPSLTFQVPDFYSSYEFFVNGNLSAKNGRVDTSKTDYSPKWIPQNIPLAVTDTNQIELILHVANFHHQRGGAYKPILLGNTNYLAQQRERELASSYILTGILLMSGFFFFGLYLFGKKEKSILFFSIFCLVYSYRIIGFGIYPLHFLLPEIPWIITLKLEYLTLFLSGLFFGIYTLHLYPKETSRFWIKVLSYISLAFIFAALLLPTQWFTQLVTPYFLILIAYILYAFWIYVRASIKNRDGAKFALASTGVVFFVFLYEMMVYFGVFESSVTFTFFGYLFFFSFQSLVLTYRFSASLKRATKRAEAASKAKSQFLSTMSHEIRTPLNAIIGLSGLLTETPLNPTQDDYIKTVKISGENLLSIVNNILDYSKIESSEIEIQDSEIEIQELIENVLDLVAPLNINTSVELIYDLDESVSTFVYTDRVKLQQILINLINNAVKFTEEGEVTVHLRMEDIQNKDYSKLHFVVKDTGIGIPEEGLKKLFLSFSQVDGGTTRKYGGTGLGLVISKRLIEALGGRISVESTPGSGTKFTFFVRVKKSKKKLPPYQSSILKGKKALVIDDNPTNLKIFEQQGLSQELEVHTTTNTDYIYQNLETLDSYDFIVLDMQMPGKDGVELAKEIRSKWDKDTLPLVLLSSIHAIESKEDIALFNLQLTKPVKQSQLFRTLESIFIQSKTNTYLEKTKDDLLVKNQSTSILVAEDNVFNQKVADKILERLGFKSSIVENGKEAFDAVLNEEFDIIFMDVEMPVMDGIEATKALRASEHKLAKRPVIIAMTANALAEDKQKCLDAGMDDFISKPATVDSVNKVLKKWL